MPVGSTAKAKVYLMKLNCKSYVFVNPVESMQATLSASELNYIVPYAYGALYAYGMPIRVWDRENAHTRTGYPIRVWVVPYAYGTKYAYGMQQPQSLHAFPRYATSKIVLVSSFFSYFLPLFAHLQKLLQNANTISDCLDILHREGG